jgi:hypothetical protein
MSKERIKSQIQSELDEVCDKMYSLERQKYELEKEMKSFNDETFNKILGIYTNFTNKCIKAEYEHGEWYMYVDEVKYREDEGIFVCGYGHEINNDGTFLCNDMEICIYENSYGTDNDLSEAESYVEITKEEFESSLNEAISNWLTKHNMQYGNN